MRVIPWVLIAYRALASPAMLVVAWLNVPAAYVFLLVSGLLSDLFDGVLARRQGSVTERLRWVDSRVDTVFVLCAAVGLGFLKPTIVRPYRLAFGILILGHGVSLLMDRVKFGRLTSLHLYSSKVAITALAIAAVSISLFQYGGIVMTIALVLAFANLIEGLAIKVLLREAAYDISGFHAVWSDWRRSRRQ